MNRIFFKLVLCGLLNLSCGEILKFDNARADVTNESAEKSGAVNSPAAENDAASSPHLPLSGLFSQSDKYQCKIKGDLNACEKIEDKKSSKERTTALPGESGEHVYGPKFQRVHLYLARREQKPVGYEEKISFNGREMNLKVLSERPFIFEVSNFVSDNETELTLDLAEAKKLKRLPPRPPIVYLPDELTPAVFDRWDKDFNGHLSLQEFYSIPELNSVLISYEEYLQCLKESELDKDNDGFLSYGELSSDGLTSFKLHLLSRETSKHEQRANNTRQTWLRHDEDELMAYEGLLEDFHQRISKLTGLPEELIAESEPLQVTEQMEGAFTECEYDSSNSLNKQKCCVRGRRDCRMCRYMTIKIFLNNVEAGGELIFPFADNATFSWNNVKEDTIKKCERIPSKEKCNLVVKPRRGTAVFYYNHEVSPYTGWIGEMDPRVNSATAPVEKGVMYSGKMWVNMVGDGVHVLRPWRSGENWLDTEHPQQETIVEKMRNDFFIEGEQYLHYYRESYQRVLVEHAQPDKLSLLNAYMETDSTDLSDIIDSSDTTTDLTDNMPKLVPLSMIKSKEKIVDLKTEHSEVKLENNNSNVENKSVENNTIITTTNDANVKTPNVVKPPPMQRQALITEPVRPDPLPARVMSHKRREVPLGPPKRSVDPEYRHPGKIIENRLVKASLILLEELERDELEIIARALHEKLQLACIPLIVNPLQA